MLRKIAILLDPKPNEGGTFVPPKVTKPAGITPKPEIKEPPKEVLERSFSLENAPKFEDDPQRVLSVDDKTGKEKELKVEPKHESEQTDKGTEKNVQGEKQRNEDGTFKKTEEGGDEKKVSSVFKPPTKVEKKDETDKKSADDAGKVSGDKRDTEAKSKLIVPPKKENQRDYTGFAPEEVSVLKQMSNEAFDFTAKLLRESKKPVAQEQWYQHPQAYLLSPQYAEGQRKVFTLSREAEYWQQQLLACAEGKPVRDLAGVNPQTGEPVPANTEIPPSKELEEKLRSIMIRCQNRAQQEQGALEQIGQQYKQRIDTDLQMIQSERAKRFGWVTDPSMLEWTVTTEEGDKPVKDIRNDVIGLFPTYLRNSPAVEVAADLMVALVIANGELSEARKGQKVAEVKQEELRRAEPSSQVKPAPERGQPIGGVREFSVAGMPSMNV